MMTSKQIARTFTSCAKHQKELSKSANHSWMLPKKPWSCLHLDHAINFMGTNWLVLVDTYSKYPGIHTVSSTSTKEIMNIQKQEFAHFGYPHTLVMDNATPFISDEFQEWCRERGTTQLSGALYHLATKGSCWTSDVVIQPITTKASAKFQKLPRKNSWFSTDGRH